MQEFSQVTKEIQKSVLKAIVDSPTSTIEELSNLLKGLGKTITKEEIIQVIKNIAPTRNWIKINDEEIKNEILNFVWNLECQILFNLSMKQKETTIPDLNQLRLSNQQIKVSKDLVKSLVSVLLVEGKNLYRFRKFESEHALLDDIDLNTQVLWALRIIMSTINVSEIKTFNELSIILEQELSKNFPQQSNKVGKTLNRIVEKFLERYFLTTISEREIKEKIQMYQLIFNTCKNGIELNSALKIESSNFIKQVEEINKALEEIKKDSSEVEQGFLTKLFSSKIKNQENICKNIEKIKNSFAELKNIFEVLNKSNSEKSILIQNKQTDLDSLLLLKGQMELEVEKLNEKINSLQNNNQKLEQEVKESKEQFESLNNKTTTLKQKTDQLENLQTNFESVRNELNLAKEISVRLYKRVNRLKLDIKESSLN